MVFTTRKDYYEAKRAGLLAQIVRLLFYRSTKKELQMSVGSVITRIQFIHTFQIYQSGKSNNSLFNILRTVGFVGINH